MTAETYVKQIVKKVKCSKKKRIEIRRQLLADVSEALEQGASLKKVMLDMGEPIAIAEEFNENLSVKERKAYKKGIIIKITASIAVMAAAIVLLLAWFLPKNSEFGSSGIYTEADVEAGSKEVVRLLDAEDYETLLAGSDDIMKKYLTKELIYEAKAQTGTTNWGELQEFGKCYMWEMKQRGKTMAVAQINVAYENIGITYTVFFDKDMKLAGLYIK